MSLVAFDWQRAFDSVHIGRLLQCLHRFGIRGKTLKIIATIMKERRFFVQGSGNASTTRQQSSGVSQGCTLSPLLFVVIMSAVMMEAVALLSAEANEAYKNNELADIIFADDTLLIRSRSQLANVRRLHIVVHRST